MGAPKPSLDQIALILAEATLSTDAQVVKRHGICRRSLSNYRARLSSDPALSRLFSAKKNLLETNWSHDTARALGRMIRKLESLVDNAGKDQIREVAGAIKIVGELELARGMIGSGKQPGTTPTDAEAPTPPRPGQTVPDRDRANPTSVH
jgi:hypothetical protein